LRARDDRGSQQWGDIGTIEITNVIRDFEEIPLGRQDA